MEELRQLEGLLDALVNGLQEVLASGEVLSDEFQGMLAEELETTFQRIEHLKNQDKIYSEIPPDAQLLWVLAGQQQQPFVQYLATYRTPSTLALLKDPQNLQRVIESLQKTMPQGEQPIVDGIPHADLNSSNVWGTAYNPASHQMKIRFQGGSEYEYDGIPENIYKAVTQGNASAKTQGKNEYGEWWPGKNPSMGAALNQYVKASGFPYRKIK